MDKAKLRQRIILGLVALTVLYGLYNLASSKLKISSPDLKARTAELQAFLQQTTVSTAKDTPSALDAYVVRRAVDEWSSNPFSGQAGSNGLEKQKEAVHFAYTGYVEMAGRRVAIINKLEYSLGDPLDKEGYFVKDISPASVLIENTTDKTEFEVPIKE